MRRTLLLSTGWFLIVLGALIAPIPGPGGAPVAAAGAWILLGNSRWARRRFIRLSRRYPRMMGPIRRVLQRRHRRTGLQAAR